MSDKKALLVADIHHGVTIGKLGASGLDLRLEDTLFLEAFVFEGISSFGLKFAATTS